MQSSTRPANAFVSCQLHWTSCFSEHLLCKAGEVQREAQPTSKRKQRNGSSDDVDGYPGCCRMQVLHLTTIGRRTGLPREIEIWFVVYRDRFIFSPKQVKPPRGSRISGATPRS